MVYKGDAIVSYAIIDLLVQMFFQLLGDGMIMVTFLSFMIIIFLAAAKQTNPGTYLAILMPMWIGFVINKKFSNYIYMAPWLVFPILMVAGIIFAIALIKVISDN